MQDVVHVTELLARQLYSLGDKLLEQATPIALTINDLHCITKRLRLPMDLQHSRSCDSHETILFISLSQTTFPFTLRSGYYY